jgi:hypothetical protein
MFRKTLLTTALALPFALASLGLPATAQQQKTPNIVMLMTDDTGWNDWGAYGGGANFGHPTPNIDRVAHGRMARR